MHDIEVENQDANLSPSRSDLVLMQDNMLLFCEVLFWK